jgi:HAE1 family hydrophobic/amphiphilic exporter-1
VDTLRRVNVNPSLVPSIPLDTVASIEEGYGPSEIRRLDQQRVVAVRAGMDGFDLGASTREVGQRLESLAFPEDMHWQIGGQAREMRASLASLWFAIGLALFLVYAVMASTFENLVHPFVILVSVPLAGVGAVAALAIGGSPVSVVVLLGAVVLVGVVVNNAIVLVDTIGRERRAGEAVEAAVLRAGSLRLRPILITTATTVVGLAPLALGVGTGAEIQGPLAQTVVGGLLSSTFLTLGVVPVFYVVVERWMYGVRGQAA